MHSLYYKNQSGFSACERYMIYGSGYENMMVYCFPNRRLQIEESFRNHDNAEHHIGHILLVRVYIKSKINIILDFVLDKMHLCSEITKKLIEY